MSHRERSASPGGCYPQPAAVFLLGRLSLSVLFSGDGFQLMCGACTCIQMPRGQGPSGSVLACSPPSSGCEVPTGRKSQGLLRGRDHQALSWPEAARLPAPLRAGVPVRPWPLGGLRGTGELLGQSVAVWGREVGKALPLGTEPLAEPLPSLGLVSHCLPVPGRREGPGHSVPLSPESWLWSRSRLSS